MTSVETLDYYQLSLRDGEQQNFQRVRSYGIGDARLWRDATLTRRRGRPAYIAQDAEFGLNR